MRTNVINEKNIKNNDVSKRRTRVKLLAAAAALFRQKGYGATTTRELAAALGLKNASLYHHIGGKEDLLYAICIEGMAELQQEVSAAIKPEQSAKDRIIAMIHAHTVTTLANQDKFSTMLFEFRALSGARRKEILTKRKIFVEMIEKEIANAHNEKFLRDDISAKNLALAWFNLVNWPIFWYSSKGKLTPGQIGNLMATIFTEGAGRK
jgi:TetR/AcrR family transcriptional regulator, cholesterol catabolism regulator